MSIRVRFGSFVVDSRSRQLVSDGRPVHLSPKAFDALCLLLENRPNAVSKADLHARVWPGTFVVDANLTVLVAELRRALGDEAQGSRFIRTVHRHGYAFCGEAVDVESGPAAGRGEVAPRTWLAWDDRVLLLGEGENIIGRDPRCGVWLDMPGVSRRHARILVAGDMVQIEDLGSKNGTFVGDDAVSDPRRLLDGDAVQIGPVHLSFRTWSDTKASETVKLPRVKAR